MLAATAVLGQGAIDATDIGDQLAGDGLALLVDRAVLASRRAARSAESWRGAPPGRRSRRIRCRRLIARRRSPVSSSRRSESSRSTARWSSAATAIKSVRCCATTATLRVALSAVTLDVALTVHHVHELEAIRLAVTTADAIVGDHAIRAIAQPA